MGRRKEEITANEEMARQRAIDAGEVCGACAQPLLTESEKFDGVCDHCSYVMNKDD